MLAATVHVGNDRLRIGNLLRRRLRAANLTGRVARKKPLLTITHKQRRLDFAKKHKSWSKEDWNAFFEQTNLHSLCFESVEKIMFEDDQERNLTPNV